MMTAEAPVVERNLPPLVRALKQTGTGDSNLRPCFELLAIRPHATDQELFEAILTAGPRYSVTASKARKLLGGLSPDHKDFVGVPPVNSRDEKQKRQFQELAETMAETIGEVVASAVANPKKMPKQVKAPQDAGSTPGQE